MKTFLKLFLAVGLVVLMAAPSLAGLAVDFTSPTPGNDFNNGLSNVGFQFTTSTSMLITALGYYDAGLDGLLESHAVGIFDANDPNNPDFPAAPLVSTTVPAGNGNLNGFFQMSTLTTAYNLAPGNYYLMGVTGAGDPALDPYTFDPNGFTVGAGITFVAGAFASGGDLTFPAPVEGVNGYFGPNFATGTSPVPVPPTVLLLGSGLLGLVGLRRFRKG
ncbi:MAG: PEP-CTERM sorting domain-containing protein [Syntrophobacterales bacterium]|jgi:hypothetical protein|nr:PEP-CTERM sorting domain-containing protein [Syntrophobacterales bacterium]